MNGDAEEEIEAYMSEKHTFEEYCQVKKTNIHEYILVKEARSSNYMQPYMNKNK